MSKDSPPRSLPPELVAALQRIEAIENTLGALTMLAVRHLPQQARQGFAEAIAALGATAEKHGDMAGATLLTQLHGAAVHGARG